MKNLLFALSLILLFTFAAFAQSEPAGTPNPATVERVNTYTELTEIEKQNLVSYLTARASIGFCGYVPTGTGCKENSNYEQKYIDALQNIVKSPKLTAYLVSNAARSFEGGKISARSAPQISQIADEQNAELNRIIVIQNQRIIDLLEQLVKKK